MDEPVIEVVSKSKYLSGLQCLKRLWIELREPQRLPPFDAATRARFAQGHEVGSLAKQLFPGGIEIGPEVRSWQLVVEATRRALSQSRPLFEAAFRWRGAACRVDILVPASDGSWNVFEVKSTTSVKDVHYDDLALQAYVVEGSGMAISDYYLVHIDSSYVRLGELDLEALFRRVRVTDEVRARQAAVEDRLAQMHETLRWPQRPEIAIGPQCDAPYVCPLKSECWSFLPPLNVLDLTRDKRLGFEILSNGVEKLAEIPDTLDLDRRQRLQLETVRSGAPHVDREKLAAFLSDLVYPLHYFDVETFASAVPLFDRSRPYQQIPFLFSIHRVAEPGGEAGHFAHLVTASGDPRPDFLRAARNSLGNEGSIVAFNAAFEQRILTQSAADTLPELMEWTEQVADRFIDLLAPFRQFSYHHPDQLGKVSLKAVLGPLTGLSYGHLEISDGEQASREYLRVWSTEIDPHERSRVLRQIEAYCSLDTLGMVAIVDKLQQLTSRGGGS